MAKTLNSICFTTLLLVLLFISAEIPKSEALCSKFIGEATVPYPCKEDVCEAKCHEHYEHSCRGECEDHDDHDDHEHDHEHEDHDHEHEHEHEHCHCYSRY